MTPPPRILVLRPAPGNAETVARFAMAGVPALPIPLFRVEPAAWTAPDPANYDALLLSSANAVRHAGPGLAALSTLPAWCVSPATAAAAAAAGLVVARTGDGGIAALLVAAASAAGSPASISDVRLLWLCGAERTAFDPPAGIAVTPLSVYRTIEAPFPPSAAARPCIALLHSARAARRFAALVADRAGIAIIAIAPAVADAAGTGWHSVTSAAVPDDGEMVAIALALCQTMHAR